MTTRSIDNLYKILFRKSILVPFIFLLIYLLFHKPFEDIFSNTFINYFLKYIKRVWYNDIVFIFLVLIVFLIVIKKFRQFIPSVYIHSFFTALIIIYCFYRFGDSPWNFTSFSFTSNFKYADSIVIIFLATTILFIKPKKKEISNNIDSFADDEPLGIKKKDELGYSQYAASLARKINSTYSNRAFAIAINGKWGFGKTSFIDLLKRSIPKNEEIIEIDFNPWSSNSAKALIQDFFETIQEKIKPYHSTLSKLLVTYSNKLVSLNNNTLSQSIQASVSTIAGFESLNSLFDEINNSLKKINKKIIIYIDDLDRLDKSEILEIIRLIRNTANFHNTFFIVAYDRNYVIHALKGHNDYNTEHFLEKIFQLEITLPYFKKNIFRHKLADRLKNKLPKEYHETIHEQIIGTSATIPTYLDEWLENMRDVTRLTNALTLNLYNLLGEVVFEDFMKLELIRLRYPSVYELLFKRTNEFLQTTNKSGDIHNYHLKNIDNKTENIEEKNIKTHFELYLLKNYENLSIPKNEIRKIVSFIENIFEGTYTYSYIQRPPLSVIYPSKFNRYFAYALLEGSLSEIEFSKARTQSQDEFNFKISEWVKKGLLNEVANRLEQIKSFDNREDFEKIIKAIFYFANFETEQTHYWLGNKIGYNGKDIIEKLNTYENRLAKKYYGESGEINLKKFIENIFLQSQDPFSFEATLISTINSEFEHHFPLSKEELLDILFGYFDKYCSNHFKLDSNIWLLYHSCKYKKHESSDGHTYYSREEIPNRCKQIFQNFVLTKDLDGYILAIIELESFNQKLFAVSQTVLELFGNWEDFKKIINEQDKNKWKYLEEFQEFFKVFEEKSFSKYVPYKFNIIPVHKKLRKESE